MKLKSTTILQLMLLFISLQTACRKEEQQEKKEEANGPVLPVKFESQSRIILLKYLPNTNLLSQIEDKSGTKEVIRYTKDQLINGFESYENGKLVYTADFFRDEKQRLITVNQFKENGPVSTPTGYYTLEYNSADQVSKIKSYNPGKKLLSSKTLLYDELSNLVNEQIDFPLPQESNSYRYDQKKGICSAIANAFILSLESRHKFFASAAHNLLSREGTIAAKNFTFLYQYKTNDYPDQFTLTGQNAETFQITYQPAP
ncbi:hypothetical protein [Pedobacter nutrimenti]|nr:hypothetical protein [Pedobacter nutrimenti]